MSGAKETGWEICETENWGEDESVARYMHTRAISVLKERDSWEKGSCNEVLQELAGSSVGNRARNAWSIFCYPLEALTNSWVFSFEKLMRFGYHECTTCIRKEECALIAPLLRSRWYVRGNAILWTPWVGVQRLRVSKVASLRRGYLSAYHVSKYSLHSMLSIYWFWNFCFRFACGVL